MSHDDFSDFSSLLERSEATDAARHADVNAARTARRRGWRVAIASLIVLALIALGIGGYVAAVLTASPPVGTTAAATLAVEPAPPLALSYPPVGAVAVSISGAEALTGAPGGGELLGASGGDGPRSIASITKLITALMVLEEHPLAVEDEGPTLTFDEADSDLYDDYYVQGATVQSMKEGSSLSERDVLELMLVASATNYADVVSQWAFGSPARFRTAASDWLTRHGLTSTVIVEPTGLDPRNTSTPTDLLVLGRLALDNPVIATIVGSDHVEVPGIGRIGNTNGLLSTGGVTGIKTGTLDEAGACVLFSAVLPVGTSAPASAAAAGPGSVMVIGVVLGAPDHYSADSAARDLLDGISASFHDVPLIAEGDVVGSYTTAWGESTNIVAGADAAVLTWSDQAVSTELTVEDPPRATVSAGQAAGTAMFTADRGEGGPISVPLVFDKSVDGPSRWWRLLHHRQMLDGD